MDPRETGGKASKAELASSWPEKREARNSTHSSVHRGRCAVIRDRPAM